jgi:uncharacterized protein (DUF433 family)
MARTRISGCDVRIAKGGRFDAVKPAGVARKRDGRGYNPRMTFARITHDPQVMGGKPCVRGLRVTVSTILGLLAAGRGRDEILHAYPYLEPGDLDEALAYAAWRLEEAELPLVPSS